MQTPKFESIKLFEIYGLVMYSLVDWPFVKSNNRSTLRHTLKGHTLI